MKDWRQKCPKDKTHIERGLGREAVGDAACCCGWEGHRPMETYGSDGLICFSCGEEERHYIFFEASQKLMALDRVTFR